MRSIFLIAGLLCVLACNTDAPNQKSKIPENQNSDSTAAKEKEVQLTKEQANYLAQLPLKCMQQEYPNKLGQVVGDASDLQSPRSLHPSFYGCFDWHSAVHGHWMLVELLKRFPTIENADEIRKKLVENISKENIQQEVKYFEGKFNKSYERTYGWAWLLKLSESLYTWNDPIGKNLHANLEPLTQLIRNKYLEFLPKLYYPIRVGEHTNTGFGISFAWDYAKTLKDQDLMSLISQRAKDWFMTDENCPLVWEPSGYDFLSPCLEEADIMRRVLAPAEFDKWLNNFLPQLYDASFKLAPGQVTDRTDGKLVHLDGLNFSRAWVLFGLEKNGFGHKENLQRIANEHINFSLSNVVDGDYAGEHWLASFALYALICGE